jgi:hypothetical protein
MKKFVHKVQELGNKAAQIKAAIESVPPRVGEVRQAIAATASQFQQLRSEVQSNVTTLRADSEEKLIETLTEIDGNAAAFREAGYDLYDVEMELGIPQRLIVHLEKVEDVPYHHLRSVAAANENKPSTHAILSALIKAEEMDDRVNLVNLTYHKLVVYVGPLPVVRLCWCSNTMEQAAVPTAPPALPAVSSTPSSSGFSSSMFGSSSFFEKRTPAVSTTTPSSETPAATPHVTPTHAHVSPEPAPHSEQREDPLARFKKMPNLTKRH